MAICGAARKQLFLAGFVRYSLSSDHVKCLYKDNSGNLWIGTARGLNVFDYETHTFISAGRNTIEKQASVIAITEDKKHNLWIPSSEGIICLPPQ